MRPAIAAFCCPVDSSEKVTLCITLLVSLTLFQMLMFEIMVEILRIFFENFLKFLADKFECESAGRFPIMCHSTYNHFGVLFRPR